MFDHIGFAVTDYAASRNFFVKALEPLGVVVIMEGEHGIGLGVKNGPMLWLAPAPEAPGRVHLAFSADTRAKVDEFYRAAMAAGGQDNGGPGLRPQYHANYYGAFVIAPDGHNVEAVCHKPA